MEDDTGTVVAEVAPGTYDESTTTVSTVVALPIGSECKLFLLDSYGDGFTGRVVVYLGDTPDDSKILGYYVFGSLSGFFTSVYEFPITVGEDGILPNTIPTPAPSSSSPTAPTVSPAPTFQEVPVLFVITTDWYPSEIGWFVSQDEEVVYEVATGTYDLNFSTYSVIVPLFLSGEYQLTLTDSYGDGLEGNMTVYLGEEAADDRVLTFFDGDMDNFTHFYTLNFLVSEDGVLTDISLTVTPSVAPPTPSPGKYSPYNICGETMSMVTKPDAIWDYTLGISMRCGTVEINGAEGLISEDYRPLLPSLLGQVCGCEDGANKQITTTPNPTSSPSAVAQGTDAPATDSPGTPALVTAMPVTMAPVTVSDTQITGAPVSGASATGAPVGSTVALVTMSPATAVPVTMIRVSASPVSDPTTAPTSGASTTACTSLVTAAAAVVALTMMWM